MESRGRHHHVSVTARGHVHCQIGEDGKVTGAGQDHLESSGTVYIIVIFHMARSGIYLPVQVIKPSTWYIKNESGAICYGNNIYLPSTRETGVVNGN